MQTEREIHSRHWRRHIAVILVTGLCLIPMLWPLVVTLQADGDQTVAQLEHRN